MSIRRTTAALAVLTMILAACGPSGGGDGSGAAGDCHVGMAWATFQEERYGLRDLPGLEAALEAGGATLTDNDAANSAETQASNVEALLDAGIDVLILNSAEPESSLQSVEAAVDAGIPIIAYDRELESADALFMTHDNVGVGRMIAEAVTEAQPTGNYAIIKGQEGQTNPLFLRQGFEEVIAPLIEAGDITIPEGAEVYTDEWLPDNAQDNMETILTANDNDIQAVLAQNDGMAGGVIAALAAQGLDGEVAVGGQDGDKAAINRVALGTQVVSVLKDATELGTAAGEAALQLCENPDISAVEGAVESTTVGGIEGYAVLLDPLPITRDNLQAALDLEWLTVEELCADVPSGTVDECP
ncbi:MAG TPA: substrate-binding domain-containing protein [Candidatus Limnocylindria bacterium]|nr:substrate-binding domain-containing protein [Candidatus Limnocylindria bacterium]